MLILTKVSRILKQDYTDFVYNKWTIQDFKLLAVKMVLLKAIIMVVTSITNFVCFH